MNNPQESGDRTLYGIIAYDYDDTCRKCLVIYIFYRMTETTRRNYMNLFWFFLAARGSF